MFSAFVGFNYYQAAASNPDTWVLNSSTPTAAVLAINPTNKNIITSVTGGESFVISNTATFQFSKNLASSGTFLMADTVVDSSSNTYQLISNFTTVNVAYLVKFDSTGAILWQKQLSGTYGFSPYSIALDSTQTNVYVAGQWGVSGTSQQSMFVKFTSAGVYVNSWQTLVTSGTWCFSITLDSSDNIYVGSQASGIVYVTKYNSSVVHQWTNRITRSSLFGGIVRVDTSGNVYCSTQSAGSTVPGAIFKYNSAGTQQWFVAPTTTLGNLGGSGNFDVDSSTGNVFWIQTSAGTGTQSNWVASISSAGALNWGAWFSYPGAVKNQIYTIRLSGNNIVILADGSGTNATYPYTLWSVKKDGSTIGGVYTVPGSANTYSLATSARTVTNSPTGYTLATTTITATVLTISPTTPALSVTTGSAPTINIAYIP